MTHLKISHIKSSERNARIQVKSCEQKNWKTTAENQLKISRLLQAQASEKVGGRASKTESIKRRTLLLSLCHFPLTSWETPAQRLFLSKELFSFKEIHSVRMRQFLE